MRLLIVDDHAVAGEMLCELLAALGHRADWAATGESALVRLGAHAYDVVVMDYYMPGLDGVATLARLRAAGSRAPAVLATAAGGDPLDAACSRLAALQPAALLRKPFDANELLALIESLRKTTGGAEEP